MFHRIAAGELPLLVHCTAGKDRTGVAIALLLESIGVPRATITADYELTEKLLPIPDGSGPGQLPEGSRRALWRADPDYLLTALDSVDREYGSINNYLTGALGLTRAEITTVRMALLH
jgi:protein-tyrosine phosphatase